MTVSSRRCAWSVRSSAEDAALVDDRAFEVRQVQQRGDSACLKHLNVRVRSYPRRTRRLA